MKMRQRATALLSMVDQRFRAHHIGRHWHSARIEPPGGGCPATGDAADPTPQRQPAGSNEHDVAFATHHYHPPATRSARPASRSRMEAEPKAGDCAADGS